MRRTTARFGALVGLGLASILMLSPPAGAQGAVSTSVALVAADRNCSDFTFQEDAQAF